MAQSQQQLAAFEGGEVTPALRGRSDAEEYPYFVETLENMYVEKYGGIKRRPGMHYVNEARDDKVRLVPFIFSREDSYVMEFGNRYVRFFRGEGYVENVGAIQTYLTDGATTKFQYPYGMEQESFAGDAVETTFTYTFTVAGDFKVFLYTGGAWVEQVVILEPNNPTAGQVSHDATAKTVRFPTAPADGEFILIGDVTIDESEIEVFITEDGKVPEDENGDPIPVDPSDYTVEPVNTLDNLLSVFGTAGWNPDAESVGTPWTLPNDGTATSPVGAEPILREIDINLAHGSQVDWGVTIDSFTYEEASRTEQNSSNVVLIDGGDYIVIEEIPIETTDDTGYYNLAAEFRCEDTSGTRTSNFFWELRYNGTLIPGAEGTENTVGSPGTTVTTAVFDISGITLEIGDRLTLEVRATGDHLQSVPTISGSVVASRLVGTGLLNPNAKLKVRARDSGVSSAADEIFVGDLTTPYFWVLGQDVVIDDVQPIQVEFFTDSGLVVTLSDIYARNSKPGWTITFLTAPTAGEVLVIRAKDSALSGAVVSHAKTLFPGLTATPEGEPYEIQSPFLDTELDELYWAQANDVMIFCHYRHKPWRLTRYNAYEWVWDQPTLYGAPWDVEATTHSAKGKDGAAEPLIKDFPFYFDAAAKDAMEVRVDDVLQDVSDWDLKTGETFPVTYQGTVTLTEAPRIGAVVIISLKETGYNSALGYPQCVVFFQERLILAATLDRPQTVWGSRAADFFDFYVPDTAQGQDLNADDAVEYTIAAYTHESIEWLSSERVLVIGTSSTEHRLAPDEYIATDRLPQVSKMTDYGGAHQMPCYMGNMTCFVQQSKTQLRSFTQTLNSVVEQYESINTTWAAEHMLANNTLKEPYYALIPDAIGVMVRDDGQLLTCLYDPSNGEMRVQDMGWSRQITDGQVMSVCVVPDGRIHRIWVAVQREIDGVTKTYIEHLDKDVYMDSVLQYISETATDTFSGADHLEGKTVKVLIDGSVHPDVVIENGSFTTEWPGNFVMIGLGFVPKVVTMPNPEGNPAGTGFGQMGRWSEIWVDLIDSAKPYINGVRPPVRHASTPMGTPEPLVSGPVRMFNTGYDISKQITITQDLPLPFRMVSIFGNFQVNTG